MGVAQAASALAEGVARLWTVCGIVLVQHQSAHAARAIGALRGGADAFFQTRGPMAAGRFQTRPARLVGGAGGGAQGGVLIHVRENRKGLY